MNDINNRRKIYVSFILPVIVILLSLSNYLRLTNTDNIRAIIVVTLLAMGMGLGILLRNLIAYFRGKL